MLCHKSIHIIDVFAIAHIKPNQERDLWKSRQRQQQQVFLIGFPVKSATEWKPPRWQFFPHSSFCSPRCTIKPIFCYCLINFYKIPFHAWASRLLGVIQWNESEFIHTCVYVCKINGKPLIRGNCAHTPNQ